MKFYGDTGDANSGGGVQSISVGSDPFADFERESTFSGVGSAPKGNADVGKGSFDFGNVLGSIGSTAGNFADWAGSLGIPGGPNLGGIAALPGQAVDAIGNISLPYLGNDPNRQAAKLGDVPGFVGDVISAPARFVETEAAKARLKGDTGFTDFLAGAGRFVLGSNTDALQGRYNELVAKGEPIPADLLKAIQEREIANAPGVPAEYQQRLDAGENVDKLAEEMARNGVGFNNDPGADLLASFILDPTNLLSFGAGKLATIAKTADRAFKAGEELGVGSRFMGKAYDAATRGLSAGAAGFMDKVIGPTTSGVFHALGTKPYFAIRDSVGRLAPAYKTAFEDAYARGAAQLPRAVLAKEFADEAASNIKRYGADAYKRLREGDVGQSVEAALLARRKVNASQIERRTEELLNRVTPDFAGHTDEGRFIETRDKLAHITGMSPADAARALGGKADVQTAQHVHLAFYGKAGDDLARAKKLAAGAKNIDPQRIVPIAEDTLSEARAADILSGKADLASAVDQYSILRNRFGNTAFDHAKVREFIEKMMKEGALPKTVLEPITGKNKLPKALQEWRQAYEPFGYELGFAPKDGWKTIVDETGDVMYADPFVHFVSEAEPLTYRNPLGRFMDGLMRGSTQTTIIQDSRARMVKFTQKAGLAANEARAVHQKVLQVAADFGEAPRGIALHGPNVFRDIFRETLGESRYAEFIQKMDPDLAVMRAFEGNWRRVGLTQKFTGKVKTATAGRFSNGVAAMAEGLYPKLRFQLSPLFQAQEITESPFFNLMRGVRNRMVDPELQKVYAELSDLPDFKYLSEAGYVLNIAGGQSVSKMVGEQSLLGKALGRFRVPNVKAFKERQRVAQVMYEHGPAFEDAVNEINPKLWRAMTEAYGTTDSRAIADAFIRERQALTSGNLDEAMAVFDRAKPQITSIDEETVWQAFRESFRQTSQQAFKTHYFNPERGFLERTINHPYLGIYPASYMWGKVLPEFARFLLKRPFGLNAPLLGIHAYQRVQQTVLAALANDPDLQEWVNKSGDNGALYLIDQMLPATPANIPANLPAWARHAVRDGVKDPQRYIEKEAADTFSNAAGPVRSANTFINAGADILDLTGSIFERLTRTADQLDAQFRPGSQPNAPTRFADLSSAPLTDGGRARAVPGLPPGSENVFVPDVRLDPSQVIDLRGRKVRPHPRAS